MGLFDFLKTKQEVDHSQDDSESVVLGKEVIHLVHRGFYENMRTNRETPYLWMTSYLGIIQKFDGIVYLSNANILHTWDRGADETKVRETMETAVKDKLDIEKEQKEILNYLKERHVEIKEKFPTNIHVEYMETEFDKQLSTETVAIKFLRRPENASTVYIVYSLGKCGETDAPPSLVNGMYIKEGIKNLEETIKFGKPPSHSEARKL